MRVLSARILVPVAIVVVAWGAAHLLTARGNLNPQPAVWPGATSAALPGPGPGTSSPAVAKPSPTSSASASPAAGAPPFLPGVIQQLNGDARDTALGMYALITQLEAAVGGNLQQLVQRLEPGR